MRRSLAQPIPFARYRLIERIGHGGTATVYRAKIAGAAGFERDVVVKMMLPALADDPALVDMFIHEAKLTALLHHPNIAQVHELGVVDGTVFLAMEFIDGIDLSELVLDLARRGERLPVGAACFLAREICDALGYAHGACGPDGRRLGLVHRDVSPANMMLSREGSVKLLDFGIAKLLADGSRTRTQTGTLKGKYGYMAPEQAAERPIDHRADIFATGIVLHELLTGQRLFRAGTDLETLRRVAEADVAAPSQLNPEVPFELDAVVLRALARDPDARYQSAQEMSEALDGLGSVPRFTRHKLAALIRRHARPEAPLGAVSPSELSLTVGQGAAAVELADGVTREAALPTRGRWQPVVVVGAAIALGATGLVTLARRPPPLSAEPAVLVSRPPPRLAATETEGAAAGGRATAADQITLTIDSVPSGATVRVQGERSPLGSTPLVWKTGRSPVPATLAIELAGYRLARLVTDLDRDAHLLVTLRPLRPAPPARPQARPSEPPVPEVDLKQGGLVNPFQEAQP